MYAGSKYSDFPKINEVLSGFGGRILEPFFGTGRVTFEIGRVGSIGSDASEDVVNFWKSSKSKEFWRKADRWINTDTISSDDFYDIRSNYDDMDDVDRAVAFWVICEASSSRGIRRNKSGGLNSPYNNHFKMGKKFLLSTRAETVMETSSKVDVHQMDAVDSIKTHFHDVDSIFLDPPYVESGRMYSSDWTVDDLNEVVNTAILTGKPTCLTEYESIVNCIPQPSRIEKFTSNRLGPRFSGKKTVNNIVAFWNE